MWSDERPVAELKHREHQEGGYRGIGTAGKEVVRIRTYKDATQKMQKKKDAIPGRTRVVYLVLPPVRLAS